MILVGLCRGNALRTLTTTVSILKYKKYFDRLPPFIRRYFQEKTKTILGSKLVDNYKEIRINLGLLGILIILNIVLFFI